MSNERELHISQHADHKNSALQEHTEGQIKACVYIVTILKHMDYYALKSRKPACTQQIALC
jgi:hypothetical protein